MHGKIGLGLGLASALAFALASTAGPDPGKDGVSAAVDRRYRDEVRPFLETYCVSCHSGETPKSDLDLGVYPTADSVAADFKRWDLVVEQLEAGTMPPAKAKARPTDEKRRAVLAWVRSARKDVADRNAGDPGVVSARRLSNAEYDYTIRDLTGVDIRPTREFPVDPANEAGFDNSGESLAMSPALAKKYLEAARTVADHLVLKPDGFDFAPYTMLADTDRDKYCVNRIIDFYRHQKTDLADYFFAAWRFREREEMGTPDKSLATIAAESGLSAKYLAILVDLLDGENQEPTGPIAALRSIYRRLPHHGRDEFSVARRGCESMRDLVADLRPQLVPEVKNLPARGISNGSQPLVLWKNRQLAANRRRYAPGSGLKISLDFSKFDESAKTALAIPDDPDAKARFEATFFDFCSIFPDTFYVSERARVYLDPKGEKGNEGRLLSAGFHSMTGYFRDDGPLYELMLDDRGQRDLDRLWREFDFITGAPMRQYSSYLWYERAETGYIRGAPEFDFVRAEDKDAASEAKIRRFADVYLAKARRINVGERAIEAVADQFAIFSASIRQVERDRLDAEASHVADLQEFAERAYRRPLTEGERSGIVRFYRELRDKDGLTHEDAIRDGVVRTLMSPHFCYQVAPGGVGGSGVRPLSDYELANRLSYFLWSSLPDPELMALAKAGTLHEPEVLKAQTRRMLKDDRVRGLVVEFGGNWLDFRRFEEHNSVDRGRFPSFDDELRRSMFEEPVRFTLDIVRNDRPILEFLDAKHTFVNPSLAKHYGMPAPSGGPDDWLRVHDATPYGRGGLIPMAVFLTKNSPGLRTSPVKRGYWVVRRLLGETIPAPPANVPDLPEDEAKLGELTLRETLARHRADKACAGCHERFDAIGLAFEGFGPVGERRERDLAGHVVDVRATFPGGMEGSGVEGLRSYINARRRDEFVDNICRKLLAYALGRSPIPSDDSTVEALKARLSSENHRFGALVEGVVLSPQFLNKRVEVQTAEARP